MTAGGSAGVALPARGAGGRPPSGRASGRAGALRWREIPVVECASPGLRDGGGEGWWLGSPKGPSLRIKEAREAGEGKG